MENISLNQRTTMAITLMKPTPGLAAVQIPLSLCQNLDRLSHQYAAQDGATSNIPADTLPAGGEDQGPTYGWDGQGLDFSLIDGGMTPNKAPAFYFIPGLQASIGGGSPAWKDSASWGCSAARGTFQQPAAWVA
jgi:hypothetical protein